MLRLTLSFLFVDELGVGCLVWEQLEVCHRSHPTFNPLATLLRTFNKVFSYVQVIEAGLNALILQPENESCRYDRLLI
jgi:hypothetical protein